MHDWQSLSHVRWDCKFHVVIVPKYRKKILYGKFRRRVGDIIRDLCRQRGIELIEGHLMPDHIHMCLSVPPKFSIAFVIGFLKGKSAVRIHRNLIKSKRFTEGAKEYRKKIKQGLTKPLDPIEKSREKPQKPQIGDQCPLLPMLLLSEA